MENWFIFRNRFLKIALHLKLIIEEDFYNVVKYWHVKKEKKWNECQAENQFLSSIFSGAWGVLVFLKFWQFWSELTKTWSSGTTECGVWIGNCNVKVWKSTEHKLHNIWRSVKFQQNEHTPELQPFVSSLEKCKNFSKMSTPLHKMWCSHISLKENKYLLSIFINDDNLEIIKY